MLAWRKGLTRFHVGLLVVFLWVFAAGNQVFFQQLVATLSGGSTSWAGLSGSAIAFAASVVLFFGSATLLLFLGLCQGPVAKPMLWLLCCLSAGLAFFQQHYGTVFDATMINNMAQTNLAEARDLLSPALAWHLLWFAVLPSVLVWKLPAPGPWRLHLRSLILLSGLCLLLMVVLVALSSAQYASFFRNHKAIRHQVNPAYFLVSAVQAGLEQGLVPANQALANNAPDAKLTEPPGLKELVIMVVGETARADHFQLNGYARPTNPMLTQHNVISFTQVHSCGTSTAVSVPCMFSPLGRAHYSKQVAAGTLNALDVLAEQGVKVLWRDNNSDSKGVATRVQYEDFKTSQNNPMCADDGECRDLGMLHGLDKFIAEHPKQDVLIVLHQMGSHGPAYFKRYPKEFERFKPTCQDSDLSKCSKEAVVNAYDNTIVYTDYFLDQTLQFLKRYDRSYETALLYVSDHGESLGEMGVYLHGAPYSLAPESQTHVPAVLWLGKHFGEQAQALLQKQHQPLSHDDLFCALLGLFEVQTQHCKMPLVGRT